MRYRTNLAGLIIEEHLYGVNMKIIYARDIGYSCIIPVKSKRGGAFIVTVFCYNNNRIY